jgi:hypothetical protein
MRVLVKRPGETKFTAPAVFSYGDEAQLQQLIADNPDLLPGVDGGPPVVVIREFSLPVGRADLLVVDLEGGISVCECKLKTNRQVRREVIGQIVSYAGALSKMSYSEFAQRASARLGRSLTEALAAVAEDGFEPDAFHPALASNLGAGRFRLVIVVDEISDELRDAVLYLNDQTRAEFFALELAYLRESGLEILVPVVYGQEAVDRKPGSSGSSTVEGADTVIVAAKHAYDEYRRFRAYICQPVSSPLTEKTRTFRPGLKYLGFYRSKQIEPEIPKIIGRFASVQFTAEEASRYGSSGDPNEACLAEVIQRVLKDPGERVGGRYLQVFLLTAPDDLEQTLHLPQPISHEAPWAWTQHQRYTRSSALRTNPATTDELTMAETVSEPGDKAPG